MFEYQVVDCPKMIGDTAQQAIALFAKTNDPRKTEHIHRLQRLLDAAMEMGEQHSETCGCVDLDGFGLHTTM